MIALIPILIIFFIVSVLVSVTVRSMKKPLHIKGKYINSHRIRWIFIGYLFILLVCLGLVAVHPKMESSYMKMPEQKTEEDSPQFYYLAMTGKMDELTPFLKKKWTFPFQGQHLHIVFKNNEYLTTQIIAERKQVNDDKIEAVFYKSGSNINGIDVTKKIKPLQMELSGDHLQLMRPKAFQIKIVQFENPFTVNQFTGVKSFSHEINYNEGESLLYLRIPKDLELTGNDNLNIEFVE